MPDGISKLTGLTELHLGNSGLVQAMPLWLPNLTVRVALGGMVPVRSSPWGSWSLTLISRCEVRLSSLCFLACTRACELLLQRLAVLNLSANALSGPLPSGLFSLSALEDVDLSKNYALPEQARMLPDSLTVLSRLSVLSLSGTGLVGRMPQHWPASLRRVRVLNAGSPLPISFSTRIILPRCFCLVELARIRSGMQLALELAALGGVQLDLRENGLEGTLPAQLAASPGLLSLDLSYNRLNGTLPPTWASTLTCVTRAPQLKCPFCPLSSHA